MNAKTKIIGTAVLCFVAGFALHRLLTYRAVQRLQRQVESCMEKTIGLEKGGGRKALETLQQHMTSAELIHLSIELNQEGRQQKLARYEALAAMNSLLIYDKLEIGETNEAKQRAMVQIATFYNSYKNVTFTNGQLGQEGSNVIRCIETEMEKYSDLKHEPLPKNWTVC